MEKTILIDEQEVRLKSTGATVLRYKQQFGKDYFGELLKLIKAMGTENEELDFEALNADELGLLDFEVFYNFVWVLAKTADKNLPEPLEWFDTFDTFPIVDIMPEITDLLAASIQTKKK